MWDFIQKWHPVWNTLVKIAIIMIVAYFLSKNTATPSEAAFALLWVIVTLECWRN